MWWLPCKQAADVPPVDVVASLWASCWCTTRSSSTDCYSMSCWQRYFPISNSSIQSPSLVPHSWTGSTCIIKFMSAYIWVPSSCWSLTWSTGNQRVAVSTELLRIWTGQTTVSICDQLDITAVWFCWSGLGGLVVHYVLLAGLLPVTEWDTSSECSKWWRRMRCQTSDRFSWHRQIWQALSECSIGCGTWLQNKAKSMSTGVD